MDANLIKAIINQATDEEITAFLEYTGPIPAPIKKDEKVGKLTVFLNDEFLSSHDVYSMEKIQEVNIFSRIFRSLNYLVWGDV